MFTWRAAGAVVGTREAEPCEAGPEDADGAEPAAVNCATPDAAPGHDTCVGANRGGCFGFAAAFTGTGVTPETAGPSEAAGAETDAPCGIDTCGTSGTTSENAATLMIGFMRPRRPHRSEPRHAATRIRPPPPSRSRPGRKPLVRRSGRTPVG